MSADRKFKLSIELPLPAGMVGSSIASSPEWELKEWAREQLAKDLHHFCWTNQIPPAYVEYHVWKEVSKEVVKDPGVTLHVGDWFWQNSLPNRPHQLIAIDGKDVWVSLLSGHATWPRYAIIKDCYTTNGRRIDAIEP